MKKIYLNKYIILWIITNSIVTIKNGKKIYLRDFEKRDVDEIWANFNEVVEEKVYLPVYTPVIDEWEKNSWYQDMVRNGNFCMVAEDFSEPLNKRIVGQCTIESVEWEAAAHVAILGIIIRKSHRNLGLGNHLIEFVKERARVIGKRKINLSTFETNTQGLALYKKCGFKVIGKYSKQYFIEGNYIDEILMECMLD